MAKTHQVVLLTLCLGVASAQTPAQSDYHGQSWVGLLVTDKCEGASASTDRESKREADMTTTGRTTTPAVDSAGTRGSAEREATQSTEKLAKPETGDVLSRSKSSTDRAWTAAHRQARSLGASCTVDANTMKFALLLPDGKMLEFDELANQSIAKQLPSLPSGEKNRRVLRVAVHGKMQNGRIALDSIQM